MKSYGMTINGSLVNNNGVYEVGFNVKNSNGIEASSSASGDSFYDVISEVYNNILDEIEIQEAEKENENNSKIIAELEAKIKQLESDIEYYKSRNTDLKLDNDLLQKRANKVEKKESKVLNKYKEYEKELQSAETIQDVLNLVKKYKLG